MCVHFYVLMSVLESKHKEIIEQLPEAQDRFLLGSPNNWIKIIKGEEDMQVEYQAGDGGQHLEQEGR